MTKQIEQAWLELSNYIGVQPPESMTEGGLAAWARPESPHPARRNRPLLAEVLRQARAGNCSHLGGSLVEIQGMSISLESIREFQKLTLLVGEIPSLSPHQRLFRWVSAFNDRLAILLKKESETTIEPLANEVIAYLDYDLLLFEKNKEILSRFKEERRKLDNLKAAIDDPVFSDREDSIRLIDDYMECVLGPLAHTILVTEEIRSAMYDFYIKRARDAVLQLAGIHVQLTQLPSFDEVQTILDTIPKFDDRSSFEAYQLTASHEHLEQKVTEWADEVNNRFNSQINLSQRDVIIDLRKGVNIQINQQYGTGKQQNVLYNPETNL